MSPDDVLTVKIQYLIEQLTVVVTKLDRLEARMQDASTLEATSQIRMNQQSERMNKMEIDRKEDKERITVLERTMYTAFGVSFLFTLVVLPILMFVAQQFLKGLFP